MKQRSVVVGVLEGADDEVVMIPEKHAATLAQLHDALSSAETWAEFKRLAPKRYYEEALDRAADSQDEVVTPKSPFDPDGISGYTTVIGPTGQLNRCSGGSLRRSRRSSGGRQ
jgi:hypothetical protein